MKKSFEMVAVLAATFAVLLVFLTFYFCITTKLRARDYLDVIGSNGYYLLGITSSGKTDIGNGQVVYIMPNLLKRLNEMYWLDIKFATVEINHISNHDSIKTFLEKL